MKHPLAMRSQVKRLIAGFCATLVFGTVLAQQATPPSPKPAAIAPPPRDNNKRSECALCDSQEATL